MNDLPNAIDHPCALPTMMLAVRQMRALRAGQPLDADAVAHGLPADVDALVDLIGSCAASAAHVVEHAFEMAAAGAPTHDIACTLDEIR